MEVWISLILSCCCAVQCGSSLKNQDPGPKCKYTPGPETDGSLTGCATAVVKGVVKPPISEFLSHLCCNVISGKGGAKNDVL